jgi:Fe2+ or Zn2+ uptake regulation protein
MNDGGDEMELTRSEMEIMDVLWDAGQPLSRSDLLEKAEEKKADMPLQT